MTKKSKISLVLVQTCISGGMLTWLFYDIVQEDDLDKILEGWNFTSPFWLMGGLLFTLLSFILATIRWHQIGLAFNLDEPGKRMFSHFMAGQFVSNFLPSTVGGDVIRGTRLGMDTKSPQNSFASVVLDRFTGWPILGVISLIGFGINYRLIGKGEGTATTAMAVSGGTIVAFIIISYLATHPNIGKRLRHSEGILKYFSAINIGLDALRTDTTHAYQVVVINLAMQFSALLAAGCAVEALNIDEIGMLALMAYLPPILIIQVLPISIGGFGIREATFTIAFATIGVEEVQAVQLGLLLGFMNLFVSLIGVPFLALNTKRSFVRSSAKSSTNESKTISAKTK